MGMLSILGHGRDEDGRGRGFLAGLRNLSTLDKLTALALVAMSPLLVFGMWIVGGRIDRVALACGASALLAAALVVATGRRWAPLLAAMPGALTFAVAGRFILESLITPHEIVNFGFWVVLMIVMGIATVASVTGTAQHYLSPTHLRAPQWIGGVLAAIGALGVGAIVVAALPQPPMGIQVQREALTKLPGVVTKDFKFSTRELHVKAGQSIALRLDNADAGPHSFDVDALNVHTAMPSNSSSLALFAATKPGTYTFYCSVGTHRQHGMVGTLVVDP